MECISERVQTPSSTVSGCAQGGWRRKHRIKCVDTPLPFIDFIEELQCLRSQLAITALEYL